MKPLLRWAGSKKKILSNLSEYWDESFRTYIEPFAGSACFFFHICTSKSILSDINEDLINVYRVIQKKPIELHKLSHSYPKSKEKYYEIRSLRVEELSNLERAARFIYLNRYCFNGLYRTNKNGEFNVPYASYGTGSIQSKEEFVLYSEKLKNTKLVAGDFETVLKKYVKSGDFVYLDPPYSIKNKRIFNQYGPDTFGTNDIKRLKKLLEYLASKNVHFLLSYADSPISNDSFKEWNISRLQVQRNIAGFSKNRRKAGEVLVSNI